MRGGVQQRARRAAAKFEDADEPIGAVADVEQRLNDEPGPPDPDGDDASVTMARALVCYLADRRDELHGILVELLVLASRAEFGANPPESSSPAGSSCRGSR